MAPNNTIIMEALILEALEHFDRLIAKGLKPSKAVFETASSMSLNKFEADELVGRIKKRKIEQETPVSEIREVEESLPGSFALCFENSEQCDAATNILMSKHVAWASKVANESSSYIQFGNQESLDEAKSVLRRKWDFVENENRTVADVKFDNINDYQKVLEFMRKQGILIEYNESSSLDEDYDELLNQHVTSKKMAQKEGIDLPDQFNEVSVFKARPRDANYGIKIDPLRENKFRSANVRKRWR